MNKRYKKSQIFIINYSYFNLNSAFQDGHRNPLHSNFNFKTDFHTNFINRIKNILNKFQICILNQIGLLLRGTN